ncbi:hypothetical protein ACFORL_08900 [Legionella dresdenensis]|uniref:BNR/Asp-box repeat containing protein n=1 Tax=Legionella dresdenensis TaxID=450200 RepID=A0ABV8CGT0_9GAMM
MRIDRILPFSILVCTGINASSVWAASNTPESFIAPATLITSGYFVNTMFSLVPLIVVSSDDGTTWSYPSDVYSSALPVNFSYGYLNNGTASTGNTFVATGYYSDGTVERPLMALSLDKGITWSYPGDITSSALPADFDSGYFSGPSACSGSACIATGYYISNTTMSSYPLLALTQDSGATWSYPAAIYTPANLPPAMTAGNLSGGAGCSGNTCIAAGYFDNGLTSYPLLAVSLDSGSNWSYPASITSSGLPAPFSYGYFSGGADCSGSNCIAAGMYSDGISTYPLLAASQDSGNTWSYAADVSSTSLPVPFVYGGFNGGASCSGNTCIATGYYDDGTVILPLLALSQDGGVTWTYPTDIRTALPSPFNYGFFGKGASCSGSVCIAGGTYNDGIQNRPLLALSQDGGVSWSYPAAISSGALPSPFNYGYLIGGAQCQGLICTASGYYSNGLTELPLLALSQDGGTTWSYPAAITSSLPVSYLSAYFLGGSSVSSILSDGIRALTRLSTIPSIN